MLFFREECIILDFTLSNRAIKLLKDGNLITISKIRGIFNHIIRYETGDDFLDDILRNLSVNYKEEISRFKNHNSDVESEEVGNIGNIIAGNIRRVGKNYYYQSKPLLRYLRETLLDDRDIICSIYNDIIGKRKLFSNEQECLKSEIRKLILPSNTYFTEIYEEIKNELETNAFDKIFSHIILIALYQNSIGELYRELYQKNYTEFTENLEFIEYINNEFKEIEKNSELNDSDKYKFAVILLHGLNNGNCIPEKNSGNLKKAYNLLTAIREPRYKAYANNIIAKMYYRGIVPEKKQSYKEAFELFKSSIDYSREAKYQYAFMLSIGSGCEKNVEEAKKIYQECIDENAVDISLVERLVSLYLSTVYNEEERQKAIKLLEEHSKHNIKLRYQLALLYKNSSRPNDHYKAINCFKDIIKDAPNTKVASDACYELATIFFNPPNGNETEKDFNKSADYLETSIKLKHAYANYILGFMIQYGLVNPKKYKPTEYYFKNAIIGGHFLSYSELTIVYLQNKKIDDAYRAALSGSENEILNCKFLLGNLYLLGTGTEVDIEEALKYYRESFKQGIHEADFIIKIIENYKKSQNL